MRRAAAFLAIGITATTSVARAGIATTAPTQVVPAHSAGAEIAVFEDGTALLAYADDSGVHLRDHPRPGVWSPPVTVAGSTPQNGKHLRGSWLVAGDDRPGAVLWFADSSATPSQARLAVLHASGGPAAAEAVPATGDFAGSALELSDGTIVIGFIDADGLVLVERSPSGAYTTFPLASARASLVGLTESAGRLVAVFTDASMPDMSDRRLYAADRVAPGQWTQLTILGDPQRPVVDVMSADLLTDGSGNLVVVWSSGEPSPEPQPIPTPVGSSGGAGTHVEVIRRPAGQAWQPVETLGTGYAPFAAVSPSGVTAVAWLSSAANLPFALAGPGGPFLRGTDPTDPTDPAITVRPPRLAIDNSARAVYALDGFTPGRQIELRAGELGCISDAGSFGDPTRSNHLTDFALRGDGTGVLAWGQSPSSGPSEGVFAVDLELGERKSCAPADAALRLDARSVSREVLGGSGLVAKLRLGRPARVTTVLSGRRSDGRVTLAHSKMTLDAGTHRQHLKVRPRRLQGVQRKLRLDVFVVDDTGAKAAFRRKIRLKA